MAEQNGATNGRSDDNYGGTITVDPDHIVNGLKMNATHGVDDRVIRLFRPFHGGVISTDVRRAFRGSERYSNPETAPIHVRPQHFVSEPEWVSPPTRSDTADAIVDLPSLDERSEEDEDKLDEWHNEALEVWESDVRNMLVDELSLGSESQYDIDPIRFDVRYESEDDE